MIGKEVIKKRPVTLYEIEELIPKEGDLTYEQKATLDYIREVKRVDPSLALQKKKELLDAGIEEELVVKIINAYPKTALELQAVLSKENVDSETFEKILNILKE